MELLNRIFAIIFCILFFSWIFFKIRNFFMIRKMNFKEIYKNVKEDSEYQILSIYLFKIIKKSIKVFVICLAIGLVLGGLTLFITFITFGGIMYTETGADSTFYDNLIYLVGNYFSLFKYIYYYVYLILYAILIRSIYIDIICYKKLKNYK